jgi:hypothetical protein
MAEVFTLTIRKPRGVSFGSSQEAERAIICQLLAAAAQIVGSHRGRAPSRCICRAKTWSS